MILVHALKHRDLITDPADVFTEDVILPSQYLPAPARTTGEARLAYAILQDAAEVASGEKPAYGELPALESVDLRALRKMTAAERKVVADQRDEERERLARVEAAQFLAGIGPRLGMLSSFWLEVAGMHEYQDAIREWARRVLAEIDPQNTPGMA